MMLESRLSISFSRFFLSSKGTQMKPIAIDSDLCLPRLGLSITPCYTLGIATRTCLVLLVLCWSGHTKIADSVIHRNPILMIDDAIRILAIIEGPTDSGVVKPMAPEGNGIAIWIYFIVGVRTQLLSSLEYPTNWVVLKPFLEDIYPRLRNGFHRSSSASLVKSVLRNCSRTCGDFEQMSRKRHPPNLSQAVSFMGQ